MPAQTEHRFNVQDFHRMADAGVLAPAARVELLNGKIIDMSPIGPFHGGVVKRLSRFFQLAAKGRWIVSTQDPLRLEDFSEPQPDLMLLRPAADDYIKSHPEAKDVLLLIEVADTSLDYDREEKLTAYARAGVAEVWLINLNDTVVEIYRGPNFAAYGSKTVAHSGDKLSPQSFADAILDLARLFKR